MVTGIASWLAFLMALIESKVDPAQLDAQRNL